MSHEDAGHYAGKHPEGSSIDPGAAGLIREKSRNDRITCADAHLIAAELDITPAEIGKTVDLLEIRIERCQLGLFGYGGGKRSIITPAETVPEHIRERIMASAESGRISCLSLWEAADDVGVSKLDISSYCESLGLKIGDCQLGAF